MKKLILYGMMFFSIAHLNGLAITRVILSSDTHPNYLPFWPLVAEAWTKLIGVRPTLVLIADSSIRVDETCGDVIYMNPIPGVPTSVQAQTVRLLMPAFFEHDVCIISDIDMIPIDRNYFQGTIATFSEDSFVVYQPHAYGKLKQFPMCYVAGSGKLFKEIFGNWSFEQLPGVIKKWYDLKLGWHTDEIILYRSLTSWPRYNTNCIKLEGIHIDRLTRSNWNYDVQKMKERRYTDCHLLRPYFKYKQEIDRLIYYLDLI